MIDMEMFNRIHEAVRSVSRWISYLSMAAILIVMAILVTDIILRNFFRSAILGAAEMVEMGMVLIVFCGFAYTQVEKGHVHVTRATDRLPNRARHVLEGMVALFTVVLSCLVTISSFRTAAKFSAEKSATAVLNISSAPFACAMAIAMAVFTLVLFFEAIESFLKIRTGGSINGSEK
jgi:TRAP-type C4-dicarboxylate transport system permease small subunit